MASLQALGMIETKDRYGARRCRSSQGSDRRRSGSSRKSRKSRFRTRYPASARRSGIHSSARERSHRVNKSKGNSA